MTPDRPPPPPSPWMTAQQAYLYLGLPTVEALYQAVRRGQVPGLHRLGAKRMRFNVTEMDKGLLKSK